MGCDKEMMIGANTVYCILVENHNGECVWSEVQRWSYHHKFDGLEVEP